MLKFKIFQGKITAINVTDVPTKGLRPVHWDQIAAELTEALGGDWQITKLGGVWFVFDREAPATRASREHRSLERALGDATGLATVKLVPTR